MILSNENEYAVALDACVLAPMPLADTLLRLAEAPSIRAGWPGLLILRALPHSGVGTVHAKIVKVGH